MSKIRDEAEYHVNDPDEWYCEHYPEGDHPIQKQAKRVLLLDKAYKCFDKCIFYTWQCVASVALDEDVKYRYNKVALRLRTKAAALYKQAEEV